MVTSIVMITLRAETPSRGKASPRPFPSLPSGPAGRTHPRLGPLGTNHGAAMPTRPQKAEKRTMGSAKLCAVMAAPAAAHPHPPLGIKSRPLPRAAANPRRERGALTALPPPIDGRALRPPHRQGAPQRGISPNLTALPLTSLRKHAHTGSSIKLLYVTRRERTAHRRRREVEQLRPAGHLGTRRSSLMSHSAALSSAREPDWCVAASGVGM